MDALVSIVIPVYNRKDLIQDTLESILNQTYTHWECILVDDHSNDGTFEYLASYIKSDQRFKLYSRPESLMKGGPSCRNYGFTQAKGEYIQWFDSDDLMHQDMLKLKVQAIESGKHDYVVCLMDEFEDKTTIEKSYQIHSKRPVLDYFCNKLFFFTPGPLFSRTFLQEQVVDLFQPALRRHQEWEFYFRVIVTSLNYKPIDKVLIHRRIHKESLSKKIKVSESAEFYLKSRILALQFLRDKRLSINSSNSFFSKNLKGFFLLSIRKGSFNVLKLTLAYMFLMIEVNLLEKKKVL
ncbi:glycosyltransferase family 2 protein [Pontibacter flavimaris]|uniref:Glycosyltransferase 2-like domain-containing protein n=1 Tax=Pontibacter flavimaris TaxID=1797110 RepID=A0A1Q5PCB1_9BACT|nr:glycosyltransferase family 2 protein [Pontibacter flavimaris]OKL39876.1 hypothetical protein A3841_15990 [Pontibacter flavimaris]